MAEICHNIICTKLFLHWHIYIAQLRKLNYQILINITVLELILIRNFGRRIRLKLTSIKFAIKQASLSSRCQFFLFLLRVVKTFLKIICTKINKVVVLDTQNIFSLLFKEERVKYESYIQECKIKLKL